MCMILTPAILKTGQEAKPSRFRFFMGDPYQRLSDYSTNDAAMVPSLVGAIPVAMTEMG